LVDPESVQRRLREIDRRVGWLRAIRERDREAFVVEIGLQAQAERHLQLAIQSAIDIAIHVLAEDSAETPEDYGAAFTLLAERDVLDAGLADRLRRAAGLRNILVHGYLDVEPEQLWCHLSRLADLEDFATAMQAYLAAE
jgi:uncharacterized protein YutE (UPF0331/DUF86 family)